MKKGEFSRISSSPLQKWYPYEATKLSGGLATPPGYLFPMSDPTPGVWFKIQSRFLPRMELYKGFLTKIAHKWKKVDFREFQVHRYKKDIHMRLQGFRGGLWHPHATSFQCQTRRPASGSKLQSRFLPRMELYKGFLTKNSPQMKKGGFSRISSSPLQKWYPYEATRLSGGACDTPRLPPSNVKPDARRLVQNFRVAFWPVCSSIRIDSVFCTNMDNITII